MTTRVAAVVVGAVVLVAAGSDLGCFARQKIRQKVEGMMGEGVMVSTYTPRVFKF
jgi:hypothetical protein